VDWSEFEDLEEMAADEIAMEKGHQDFAAILSVRLPNGKNRVVGVLRDRKKETVRKFFKSIPKHLRKTVRIFCTDLYKGSCGKRSVGSESSNSSGSFSCSQTLSERGG
jgi:transposase